MSSAGEIGATFTIKDDASAILQRLADQFNALQGVIDRIKASIGSIGEADGGLAKLQEQLGLTGKTGAEAGDTIAGSFSKVDGSIDATRRKLDELRASLTETADKSRAMSFGNGGGLGGGGGGGGEGGEPHGGNSGPHGGFRRRTSRRGDRRGRTHRRGFQAFLLS
jgi:hypothetical protein